MTSNILDGLIGRIDDQSLRATLQMEVDRLRSTKDFGLVFEKHMPENVRLYSHPVRRGLRVEERSGESDSTWMVGRVREGMATLIDAEGNQSERAIDELVVIRQFGEPIYPGLKSLGRIKRGGEKPFHTIINGENYHALETLLYAYEGKVDCIYIDPPYNTGAKDWKYNNDYVATDDAYRHSKWLSFMERRLKLAQRLLNPEDSVLIITIDEKEYLRLGMLLEQVFAGSKMQMVSSVINPRGIVRANEFSRTNEFIFFVWTGLASVLPVASSDETGEPVAWETMRRRSLAGARGKKGPGACGPNQFFPIYVNEKSGHIVGRGDALLLAAKIDKHVPPKGCVAVFPMRDDGTEMNWSLTATTFDERFAAGYIRAGKATPDKPQKYIMQYVLGGVIDDIRAGAVEVKGRNVDGSIEAYYIDEKSKMPLSQWDISSHNAQQNGTGLLNKMLSGRKFPYAKSLYAVEDTLECFIREKKDALVVDFFAGSGTTGHAVMRLNHRDGGSRTSILVTNNEVSADEAGRLRNEGYYPGDAEWENLGIARFITWPRLRAAVEGIAPDGSPLEDNYRFVDEFPMVEGFEENVEFVELTYLDRNDISRGKSFEAIAPLLWLKVGACGEMIAKQKTTFSAPNDSRYAVLFDIDVWPKFVDAIRDRDNLEHVFIVTDSLAMYQQVVAELPAEIETTMLYEDYLRNFEINMGGFQ